MDQIYYGIQPDSKIEIDDVMIDEKPSGRPVELRAETTVTRGQLLRSLRAIKAKILRGEPE